MRRRILFPTLFALASAAAQTGPGGVGNSSNLMVWLAADRAITLTGGRVHSWGDGSGNTNHATNSTAANRPASVPGAVNGYPSVQFDGTNDELLIPHKSALALTQWDAFLVGAATSAKNNNAWFSKGSGTTAVNYGMWSNANNASLLPVKRFLSSFGAPATPNNTFSGSFSLLEYNHLWLLASYSRFLSAGVETYSNLGISLPPTTSYTNALRIGNADGASGWNLNGQIAELVLYNAPLNDTERIIVNNYLSAKYALPLSSGNLFVHDEPTNGNFDHDVAGIGHATGSTAHTDARGTGVIRISGASNLGANEFLFWGHDNGPLGAWSSTDFPAAMQGRWQRVWRVNEVNASGSAVDVGAVNMDFDLSGQGPVITTDLRLLVDTDNDGTFADETPIAGAVSLGGNLYRFNGVTALANNRRFTLGTMNMVATPLPVELLRFTASGSGTEVLLQWATATERDNDHFTVERSADLLAWTDIADVDGAGNSIVQLSYSTVDTDPLPGTSYYRLRQTDFDGTTERSHMVSVDLRTPDALPPPFPNPTSGSFTVYLPAGAGLFDLVDLQGRSAHPVMVRYQADRAEVDVSSLAAGTYLVRYADGRPAERVQVVRP